MSYNITVSVAGGELTVTSSGEVPEGRHLISGHTDASMTTISVSRTDVDGKQVIQSSAARPNGS